MLVYSVTAAKPVDADVTKRVLTVAADGQEISKVELAADATELGEVRFNDGASVILTLVDVDDAGNTSQPATLEFVATDTLPPASPAFGVTLVREEQ